MALSRISGIDKRRWRFGIRCTLFPFPHSTLLFSLNVKHEHKYEPSNAIVYLCHMSLPINSAGYATRTQYLLSTLIDSGLKMLPVSRLGYPYDLNKTSKKAKDLWGEDWKAKQTHDVKNVEYNILKFDNYKWNNLNLDDYIRAYSDAIIEFALIHKYVNLEIWKHVHM